MTLIKTELIKLVAETAEWHEYGKKSYTSMGEVGASMTKNALQSPPMKEILENLDELPGEGGDRSPLPEHGKDP